MYLTMTSIDIINHAMAFATALHEGQTRRDGSPYINHPIAVYNRVNDYINLLSQYFFRKNETLVAALFHDVCEDVELYKNDSLQLAKAFVNIYNIPEKDFSYATLSDILYRLTHKEEDSYADYISYIKEDWRATIVKIADLKHNLSDLKSDNKMDKLRIDKYKLALYILEK